MRARGSGTACRRTGSWSSTTSTRAEPAAACSRRLGARRDGELARARPGSVKRTTVPLAGRGVDRDLAAGVGDDAVHGREPEPGALAGRLGREERLERAVGDLRRSMPVPSSATRDLDAVAGTPATRDRSAPPCGHRVARVDREVHEHLLEPRAVGEHRRQAVARSRSAARRRSPSERDEQRLEVARRARRRRAPRACTTSRRLNISSWRVSAAARSAARPISSTSSRTGWLVGAARRAANVDAGQDHRQQVVEVVRDAARELADALQALGLGEALLELGALALGAAAVGEVRRDRADRRDLAVGVEQRELHEQEARAPRPSPARADRRSPSGAARRCARPRARARRRSRRRGAGGSASAAVRPSDRVGARRRSRSSQRRLTSR